ncbi:twin-arginine translocase subunit TatC [Breznakiella homolactica]|uniref:Sec-independent protein translocase protein TatC n=1 Tax=Breznakiella homolactica TaxID=2798577 RepID=A0A7T7XPA9_9SPIR|nr:twin-arginine translocase subunit TatC [Breznakiella homolactica]QQO10001.1 twin-arginine translocase subunit TatC [Breznakiella homolactica]
MPVIEHIRELRNSIIVSLVAFLIACVVSFIFSDHILSLFTAQFQSVGSVVEQTLVVSSIAEGFVAQLKMTVIAGFIISLPVHIFGIIKFVFPGLTTRERRIVMSFLVFSLILIVVGSYLAYFKVVPLAVAFLTNPYFVPEGVGYLLNYQTNIFYVFSFILWSVLALQTPLLMEILLIMNVLKRKQVLKASRYIIVGIFIVAAIITPPDFVSQLGVALPLVFFYFLALLIAKIFKFGEG